MFLRLVGFAMLTAGITSAVHAEPRSLDAKAAPALEQKPIAAPVAGTSAGVKSALPYANILQAPLFKTSDPANTEAKIDESALRYYAAQKNKKRVDAEIRRLKALYSNWNVPNDLYGKAGTGTDEQALWDLFATGDMLALRAAVNDRMHREVGWAPSRDLTRKIERQDAINKLVLESNGQHWTKVVELADAEPSVLTCNSIDADWRVAEAFARLDVPTRTFDIYRAILTSCVDKDERLATVRKSITYLATADVKVLIGLGEHRADGSNEFEVVKIDLMRARFNNIAAGLAPDDLLPEELKIFAASATKTRNADDVSLLGWYWFSKQKWPDADKWFQLGLEIIDTGKLPIDAKLAEGHALSLRNLGDTAGAKAFAYDWRDKAKNLRDIYVGLSVEELTRTSPLPTISDADIKQFLDLITLDTNPDGAQAMAWYHYNKKVWGEAANWFMTAIDWSEASKKTALVTEKTIEGYALSLQNMGRLEEAESVAYAAIERGPDIRRLYVNIMNDELNKTPIMEITQNRLDRFGVIVNTEHSPTGAQALAWYYQRNRAFANAVDWFKLAVSWSPDGGDAKINEGYALALKGIDHWAEAEEVAYAWRDRAPNMRAIYFGFVIDQMNNPQFVDKMTEPRVQRFEGVVLQDRSDDGAQALGWFRYGQKGQGFGVNWFKLALEWSPERRKDPKTNEGYAASLRLVGRLSEAEAVAYPFVTVTELMKKLYVQIVVEELTHDNPPEPVPEPRITNFVAVIAPDMNPLGAQALGWYRLERHENVDAVKWFRDALDWWPAQDSLKHADQKTFEDYKSLLARLVLIHEAYRKSPRAYTSTATLQGRDLQSYVDTIEGYAKTMEGYALSLRDAGDFSAAETIAYSWRDRSPGMRDLFLDIAVSELTRDNSSVVIEPERMSRFVVLIESVHSIAGAQALAWHASARKQWQVAANWFKVSMDWSANTTQEKNIDPKVAEGYVSALRNLGQLDQAEKIATDWRDRSPALRRVYIDIALEQIRQLKPGSAFPADRLSRLTSAIAVDKTAASAQSLGWYLYAQKDYENALGWFKSAGMWTPDGKGDAKSVEGYATVLKALGRTTEAVALAFDWRNKSPEMQQLYLSSMVESLTKDTKGEQISEDQLASFAETVNTTRSALGAQALGWYRFGQKSHGFAVNWFKASIEWSQNGKADAKTNEGYASALRSIGRLAEAENVVYPWVASNVAMQTLYVNIVVEEMTKDAPPEPVADARIAQFINVITPMKSALGAQALGWYRHERHEDPDGAIWFKNALDWWPNSVAATQKLRFVEDYQPILGKLALTHENYTRTPRAFSALSLTSDKNTAEYVLTQEGLAKTWEGYALTLRATGHLLEAEQIAFDWRDKWASLRHLYIDMAVAALGNASDAVIEPERFGRFRQIVETDHSVSGAQAIAWYSNAHKDYPEASNWFRTALSWRPADADTKADPKVDAKLYEGYVIALRGEQKFDEAFNIANQFRDKSPELKKQFLKAASDMLQNSKTADPVSTAMLEQLTKSASTEKSIETAQSLGWYYYGQKDFVTAQLWFKNAMSWAPEGKLDAKAIEGMALAMRSSNKASEALDFAYEMRDKASNMRELYIELVADTLSKEGAAAKISAETITKTTGIVTADHNSKGALALAWYRLGRKDYAVAAEMFKNSIVWSTDGKGDVKASEGYARALRALGRYDEAETVVLGWYEDNDAMRSLYIEIISEKLSRSTSVYAANEESLRRFASAVTRDSSANGAQALAWYSLNIGQVRPAVAWFEKSMSFEPSEGSALGLALSYKRLNDRNNYMRIIETYRDRYPKVADLMPASYAPGRDSYMQQPMPMDQQYVQPRRQRSPKPVSQHAAPVSIEPTGSVGGSSRSIGAALSKKDYGTCLSTADALEASGRLSAADAANKGWCLLNMGRPQEAAASFDRGLQGGLAGRQRDDAAYGKSMALLKNGATAEAGAAAQQGNLDPERRNQLGVEALAQQARAAYKVENFAQTVEILNRRSAFAQETRDLMMLRGWSLLKLGQYDTAKRIFQTVDTQMSTAESQAGITVANRALSGK